jgi:hypothetical protein
MKNSITASFDLCEQIPSGMFEDSYFVYLQFDYSTISEPVPRKYVSLLFNASIEDLKEDDNFSIIPAPTLSEIAEKMDALELRKKEINWLCMSAGNNYRYSKNCADAALECWFADNAISYSSF